MVDKQSNILIIGGGTFGLSAAYHLARSGYKSVTVLEKGSAIPSPLSAGNDVNKIIRAEYVDFFYCDLALEAMREWADNPIFSPHYHETGYLLGNSGAASQKVKATVARSLECIQTHPAWKGKIMQIRTRDDCRTAAPVFTGPMKGWEGYFNRFAGYAHAANALTAVYKAALDLGVKIHVGEEVTRLEYDGDRCVGVSTASGKRFPADAVVLTVGASIGRVLPSVGQQVVAKAWALAHVQLTPAEAEQLKGIPVTYARDLGFFFEPEPGTGLLKVCSSGAGLTNFVPGLGLSVAPEPEESDFIPPADEKLMRQLLRETLPYLADRPLINRRICWCADTADSDFVIDAVPGKKNLYLATGDSGHGFKMLPIAGKWIKELMEKGKQDLPRWQWKEGADATADVSWRPGELRDIKDFKPSPKL